MSLSLTINLSAQTLTVWQNGQVARQYPVSTAVNGAGEIQGSGCTPRGRHRIRAKIGAGMPTGTVFQARRVAPDVAVYSTAAGARYPGRDWILTRILWLSGTEPGKNRLGCVDTFRRYIYIHGTPGDHLFDLALGVPGSHGCIRMNCSHLIELFEAVSVGTDVLLHE